MRAEKSEVETAEKIVVGLTPHDSHLFSEVRKAMKVRRGLSNLTKAKCVRYLIQEAADRDR